MKWIFNIFIVCLFFACQYEKANNKVDFESDPIGAIPDETLEKASKAVSIPQSTEEPTIPVKHDVNVTKYKAGVSKSNLRKAEYIVIAKSGLFLRGKPGTKSEKLTKIPYFSKVKVLNDISYKLDTIRVNRYKSRPDLEWEFTNSWVKVKYRNLEGYVLSAYIAPDYKKKAPILRDEYAIAYSTTTCDFNYHPNPDLKWTGIYKDGSAKSVNFDCKFQHGNNMSPMINYVDKSDDLLFCVGGNLELDNKVIEATTNFGLGFSEVEDELKWLAKKGITAKLINNENGDEGFQYTLNVGTQRQLLNTKELGVEVGYIHAFLWIGDLDNDGIDDYIIRYGGYPDRIVLYLSSEAKEGEIVGPVAMYFSSKCC